MKYTTKTIAATFAVLVQASAFALPFELWEDDLAYLLQIVKKLAIDEQALPDFYEWQDAGNFQYLLTSFPSAAVDGIDSIRLGKSKLDTIELTITDDGYDEPEPLGSMAVRLKPSPQKDESVKKNLPFELWEDDLAYLLQIVKKLAIDEQALPDFYEWQDAGNFQYLLTSFPSAAVDGIDSIRLGKSKLDTIELTITDDGYDEPLGSMSVRLKPSPQKDESVKKKSMRIFSITNTSNVSVKRNWRRCLEKMPQKNIRSMMKRK